MKSDSDDPPPLPVTPVPLKGKKDVEGYQVMLARAVEPENVVTVEIEMTLISSVVPFPKEITQVETVCVCVCVCVCVRVCVCVWLIACE